MCNRIFYIAKKKNTEKFKCKKYSKYFINKNKDLQLDE